MGDPGRVSQSRWKLWSSVEKTSSPAPLSECRLGAGKSPSWKAGTVDSSLMLNRRPSPFFPACIFVFPCQKESHNCDAVVWYWYSSSSKDDMDSGRSSSTSSGAESSEKLSWRVKSWPPPAW